MVSVLIRIIAVTCLYWTVLAPAMSADMVVKYGEITQSEDWNGSVYLVGDVTIATGVTVTVAPGTKIYYAPYDIFNLGDDVDHTEIIVNGKFDVQSTESHPVTVHSFDEKARSIMRTGKKPTVIEFAPYTVETATLREEFRAFKFQYIVFWSIVYAMWILAI